MNYKTDTKMIRKKMIDKGIKTISGLAGLTGISKNTLGKVLNGETQPSSEVMYKLASYLEISPTEAGVIFFSRNLRNA